MLLEAPDFRQVIVYNSCSVMFTKSSRRTEENSYIVKFLDNAALWTVAELQVRSWQNIINYISVLRIFCN